MAKKKRKNADEAPTTPVNASQNTAKTHNVPAGLNKRGGQSPK